MWHRLAEVLGCSVWEAKLRVDLAEFVSWIAYFELKHEYEEAELKAAKAGGRKPPPRPTSDLPAHVPTKTYTKKKPIPEG